MNLSYVWGCSILIVICVAPYLCLWNSTTAQSQEEGFDRSVIGTVINITNNTNPTGAAVEQMIQATSTINTTSTPSGINWGDICRIPDVDSMITESCDTLTSSDGYTLTPEGNRVLYCILAGGIGKAIGMSNRDLQHLSPVAGCGPQAQ